MELQRAKLAQQPKQNQYGKRLKLATFGENVISFMGVRLTEANKVIDMVKRAGARQYTVKTDGQGAIEIEYEADDRFSIALHNHSRWVTNIYIEPNTLKIGNVAHAAAKQVSTMHVTQNENRQIQATFKIENGSSIMLKRLDVKGDNTAWFSVFSHHSNLLMVRPNGNWLSDKLLYFTDQLTTQAINNYRRSEGNSVLAANDTMVMQRRQLKQAENEMAERKREMQKEKEAVELQEEAYKQGKAALLGKFKILREKEDQYEREAAQIEAIESRRERIEAEKKHYQQQRSSLVREITEIQKATEQIEVGKRELQKEKEAFDQETKEFAIRKHEMEKEKEAFDQEMKEWAIRKNEMQAEKEVFGREMNRSVARQHVLQEEQKALTREMNELTAHKQKVHEGKEEIRRDLADFEKEVALVDSLRNELPSLVHSFPWSRTKCTNITLTSRFRVIMRNLKVEVDTKPTNLTEHD